MSGSHKSNTLHDEGHTEFRVSRSLETDVPVPKVV